jgi:AcrR family transcriptional regulator
MASVSRKTSSRAARRIEIQARLRDAVQSALEGGETYTEITIGRLVEDAGISRTAFYTYFEDKGQLLCAIAEEVIADEVESGRRWWSLPPDATKADLQAALKTAFEQYRRDAPLWAAMSETAAVDPNVREHYSRTLELSIQGMAQHIRDGQHDGTINPTLQPERTGAWLTWMGERGLHQIDAGVDELAAGYADIVWALLYAELR